nr:hypothetical protein [Streptomyces lavendulae]
MTTGPTARRVVAQNLTSVSSPATSATTAWLLVGTTLLAALALPGVLGG